VQTDLRGVVVLAAVLGLWAGAVPARAGTLTVADGELTYQAAPGEANQVVLTRNAGGQIVLSDAGAPVTNLAVPTCLPSGGQFNCSAATIASVTVVTGDLADTVTLPQRIGKPAFVSGEGGSDTLSLAARTAPVNVTLADEGGDGESGEGADVRGFERVIGGQGADLLRGSQLSEQLYGAGGADVLDGGVGSEADVLSGGTPSGPDTATDTVSYEGHLTGVTQAIGGPGEDTLSDIHNLVGSSWRDVLTGDAGANRIDGHDDDDVLRGGTGADTLIGGAGADEARYDDAGRTQGVKVDLAGTGEDAALQAERIVGSPFDDALTGTPDDDELDGGGGADEIDGRDGRDILRGGAGDDRLLGGSRYEADQLDGGEGDDLLTYADRADGKGTHVTLGMDTTGLPEDGTAGFEHVVGTPYDDRLLGGAAAETLEGGGGDDQLDGFLGRDTIAGGAGFDTLANERKDTGVVQALDGSGEDAVADAVERLVGTRFPDHLRGTAADEVIEGGLGDDVLQGGAGHDMLVGGDGRDTASYAERVDGVVESFTGGEDALQEIESLEGGAGPDRLTGATGDETLIGGGGDDVLDGGLGDDELDGGPGRDLVTYAGRTGGVFAFLAADAGEDAITGVEGLVGGSGDDVLVGGDGGDDLDGGPGKDVLDGGPGDDVLAGGASAEADVVEGGTGKDRLSYADRVGEQGVIARLAGGAGEDAITGVEELVGTAQADVLAGDAGANLIDGGAGGDFIDGGLGGDVIEGGSNGGKDVVTYANHPAGVTQAITGAGEDQLSGIEVLMGSEHADHLTGDERVNEISGNGGDDLLDGGAGSEHDLLFGGGGIDTVTFAAHATSVVQALGGSGEETLDGVENLIGGTGADHLTGDGGANVLTGGAGDDELTGAGGPDSLSGEAGDDVLGARDGAPDAVACGAGADSVEADGPTVDTVAGNCETVSLPEPDPEPEPEPEPAATPTPTPEPEPAASPVSTPEPEPPAAAPAPLTGGEAAQPARPDRAAPRLAISRALIRLDGRGRLPLSLTCRGEPCAGEIRVTSGRTAVAGGAFVLAADRRTTVRMRVGRAGRALLRRGRPVPLLVRIVVRDRAGNVRRLTARLRTR
jgi:Ca2+-binding RTX toxin-like protein